MGCSSSKVVPPNCEQRDISPEAPTCAIDNVIHRDQITVDVMSVASDASDESNGSQASASPSDVSSETSSSMASTMSNAAAATLLAAVTAGNIPQMMKILHKYSNMNIQINDTTPLIHAIAHKQSACVRMLISCGASTTFGACGVYPIHAAAKVGDVKILRLLATTCDLNQQDGNGDTALHICVRHKFHEAIAYLLTLPKTGCSLVNDQGHTVLDMCSECLPEAVAIIKKRVSATSSSKRSKRDKRMVIERTLDTQPRKAAPAPIITTARTSSRGSGSGCSNRGVNTTLSGLTNPYMSGINMASSTFSYSQSSIPYSHQSAHIDTPFSKCRAPSQSSCLSPHGQHGQRAQHDAHQFRHSHSPASYSTHENVYFDGRYFIPSTTPIHATSTTAIWRGCRVGEQTPLAIKCVVRRQSWTIERDVRKIVGNSFFIPIHEYFICTPSDIPKLHEFSPSGEVYVMVMDYSEETLHDYISNHMATISHMEKRFILQSIAATVQALHSASLIHTDIKPHNVLAVGRRWYLADLESCVRVGPSSLQRHDVDAFPRTVHHTSLAYCPPEFMQSIVNKSQQYVPTFAHDLWQFGVLAFFVITGTPLYDEQDEARTIEVLASDNPLPTWAREQIRTCNRNTIYFLDQLLCTNPRMRRPLGGNQGILRSSYFQGGASTIDVNALQHRMSNKIVAMQTQLQSTVSDIRDSVQDIQSRQKAMFTLVHSVSESDVPRLFQVLPSDTTTWKKRLNIKNIFTKPHRIHFLCECNEKGHWHFTDHKGLSIREPKEFVRAAAPYLKILLRTMAITSQLGFIFGLPLVGVAGTGLANAERTMLEHMAFSLRHGIHWTSDQLFMYWYLKMEEDYDHNATLINNMKRRIPTPAEVQRVAGSAFRALKTVIKHNDVSREYGGLVRCVDRNTGSVRWVCPEHSVLPQFCSE